MSWITNHASVIAQHHLIFTKAHTSWMTFPDGQVVWKWYWSWNGTEILFSLHFWLWNTSVTPWVPSFLLPQVRPPRTSRRTQWLLSRSSARCCCGHGCNHPAHPPAHRVKALGGEAYGHSTHGDLIHVLRGIFHFPRLLERLLINPWQMASWKIHPSHGWFPRVFRTKWWISSQPC